MEKGDVVFLNQFVNSLIETEEQMEIANASNDSETFNKLKKTMIRLQKEIAEILK